MGGYAIMALMMAAERRIGKFRFSKVRINVKVGREECYEWSYYHKETYILILLFNVIVRVVS